MFQECKKIKRLRFVHVLQVKKWTCSSSFKICLKLTWIKPNAELLNLCLKSVIPLWINVLLNRERKMISIITTNYYRQILTPKMLVPPVLCHWGLFQIQLCNALNHTKCSIVRCFAKKTIQNNKFQWTCQVSSPYPSLSTILLTFLNGRLKNLVALYGMNNIKPLNNWAQHVYTT